MSKIDWTCFTYSLLRQNFLPGSQILLSFFEKTIYRYLKLPV